MILTQCYTSSLSQASYLVVDEESRQAVVVDPLRDVEQYLQAAREQQFAIVGVILTHFHADFVAGHLELAAATGAWIGLGAHARPQFEVRLLADGERIILGSVALEIMATPGHTPESISVLVYENAEDEIAYGVLTGDSLFVGDVGRVDLQASFGADPFELAMKQYETIQHGFMALPDAIRVFPAHGAGSACGRNLSPDRESTIGRERATNPACRPMTAKAFVEMITDGQLPAPAYFVEDAALNRQAHDLFDGARDVRELAPDEMSAELEAENRLVIDTRDVESFVSGHLPGALNIPLNGRFAETAGMFLDYHGGSVILVADSEHEAEGVRQLARVGFDEVAGYVSEDTIDELERSGKLVGGDRMSVDELEMARRSDAETVLLDVRGPGEYEDGAIPGSINIPLPQLRDRLDELPRDSKILVNCASGWRSGVATSYLVANGFTASDLRGGYQAWAKAAA